MSSECLNASSTKVTENGVNSNSTKIDFRDVAIYALGKKRIFLYNGKREETGGSDMRQIEWNERYNIDVEIVDKAHQRLFSIVRKLSQMSDNERKNKWACAEGVKYFKGYALKHFAEEEAYMRSVNYSGYEMHRKLHENMRDQTLPVLEMDLVRSDYSEESISRFLGFCLGWLSQHILIEDRAITGKVSRKWVHEQSEEEYLALKQAVARVFSEDFQIDARIASRYYSGEDIGKAYYYRLLYSTKDGKKYQIFLAFEERLLLKLAGKLLNEYFAKMDRTVLNALPQLSRQLTEHVGAYLKTVELEKLEKDNLLTYDQILRAFEKEYPCYSMLFDTDAGFFAFCIKK